jgi:hypothetical protein
VPGLVFGVFPAAVVGFTGKSIRRNPEGGPGCSGKPNRTTGGSPGDATSVAAFTRKVGAVDGVACCGLVAAAVAVVGRPELELEGCRVR